MYTIGVITAHAPDPPQIRAQCPTLWPGGSKIVEVRCSCQELKPCQHWITTNEIRRKQLVESAVPCKIAKCWHKISIPCWNQTHVSPNTATCLHHYAKGLYKLTGEKGAKLVNEFSYLTNLNQLFVCMISFSACSSRISRPDKIHQNS